ncbi:MAG: hypothetical protein ACXVCY_01350 [Pseudobdellovibrionaceae bacterium]
MSTHQRVHRPSQESDLALVGAHQGMMKDNGMMSSSQDSNKSEHIIIATNKLLNELKQSYKQMILEKDTEMLKLKEEIADLKTLVQVLESENERLKKIYR